MKNIEEIMKNINPDIKLNDNIKKSLKNKLNILAEENIKIKTKEIKKPFYMKFNNIFKLLVPIYILSFTVF
jgi:hypothetical protein